MAARRGRLPRRRQAARGAAGRVLRLARRARQARRSGRAAIAAPGIARTSRPCSCATSAAAPPTSACSGSHRGARTASAPAIERIAVGDHLLLGGDNIDLALAHAIERSSSPAPTTDCRASSGVISCRRRAGAEGARARCRRRAHEVFHVALPGDGASLFASALDATMSRAEIQEIVLEGFFPLCPRDELPRRAGSVCASSVCRTPPTPPSVGTSPPS